MPTKNIEKLETALKTRTIQTFKHGEYICIRIPIKDTLTYREYQKIQDIMYGYATLEAIVRGEEKEETAEIKSIVTCTYPTAREIINNTIIDILAHYITTKRKIQQKQENTQHS